MVRSLSLAWGE